MRRILYRTWSPRGLQVRPGQPLAEEMGGFVGRPAVEGHERRGDARNTHDVRAPAIGRDGGDFDLIQASTDGLFEMMDGAVHSVGAMICL